MEDENESLLIGYPSTINYECTKKIMEQMTKNICKIKIGQNQGTGFFCKIPFPDINNMLTVFITNNHVIDEYYLMKKDAKIQLDIKEETDKIEMNLNNRLKYTNEEYDITIIEIKEEDNIKNYLELDNIIINDILNNKNQNKEYEDKTIYIIQYPKGELSVSYGILSKITLDKSYNFNHKCGTEKGSSGSPILTLNNKIIGIHKKSSNNCNKGTFLNFPLKEFIKLNYKKKNKFDDNYKKMDNINKKNLINNELNYSKNIESIRYKIIFIGDQDAEKSKIINRFFNNENDEYEPKIGLDFLSKYMKYNNIEIIVNIYDTAGQEKFRSLIPLFIRDSDIIFLTYIINSRKSFDNLEEWIKLIYSVKKFKVIICGNKIGVENREVDKKEGEEFAKKYGLNFFEVSSIPDVKNMFYNTIVDMLILKGKINNKENFVKNVLEDESINVDEFNEPEFFVSEEEKMNKKDCFIL